VRQISCPSQINATLILSEVEGWAKQSKGGVTSPGLSFDFSQDEPVERLGTWMVGFATLYPPYEARSDFAYSNSARRAVLFKNSSFLRSDIFL
jgi:hypothetical protein